jgi:hypothetical protein
MNAKTVFVVGAGASREFDLPLGTDLKKQISDVLKYRIEHGQIRQIDETIYHAYLATTNNNDINPYLKAARKVSNALPLSISIDNFLDAHSLDKDVELCGKLAIAKCILAAEQKSTIYVGEQRGHGINFSEVKDNWLNSFFKLVTGNCRIDNLKDRFSKIVFVVFNYDRCIEHYLYHALQTYYAIDKEKASELVSAIEIYHPYGTVGKLRWQDPALGNAYGDEVTPRDLIRIASGLKTFTEGVDSAEIANLRRDMLLAQKIVFLGFAYHKQNLELLFDAPKSVPQRAIGIYGTTLGVSPSDVQLIESELNGFRGGTARFAPSNSTCVDLFSDYWRSLSLAR